MVGNIPIKRSVNIWALNERFNIGVAPIKDIKKESPVML
jgi:hypothetical protein